jgi:tetratricopeptide (TPR) repeat protein
LPGPNAWTRRIRRTLAIVLLALWLALPAGALPKEGERWIRVDTDHITLFSSAPLRQTEQLGRHVEKLKQVLDATSVGMKTHSPLPTYIYVFRGNSSFRDYRIGVDGTPQNIAGYFTANEDGNYVAINVASGDRPEETILHEYVHYWLDNNVPTVPLWVGEGLAEYYSTFRSRKNVAEIGHRVMSHDRLLEGNRLLPMAEWLAADESSTSYHEDDRVGLFYAQSWVAVHFLMSDPASRGKLGVYFRKINASQDPVQAFRETWGFSPEEFGNKLGAYVKEGSYPYYQWTFEQDLEEARARVTPLDYETVLFRLGDLLAHNPPIQFESAEQHLLAALKIDGDLAPAWATLAYLDQLRGRDDSAAQRFEKALSLDEGDPRTHRLYGSSLLERFEDTLVTGFETFEEPPPMLARARRGFRRALELEPGHPPSIVGLARTYVYEPHSDEALYALQQGLDAMPSRNDLLLDLVVVSAHRGNLAGAWRILDDSLRPRGDTGMIRSAEAIIAQVSMERADELADGGKLDEAIELLRDTAKAISIGTLKRQVLAQATTLGITIADGEDSDLYRAAIDEAGEGRFEKAIAMLAEAIEITGQEQLRLVAAAQRDAIIEIKRETENITLFNRVITLANDHKFDEAAAEMEKLLARELDPDLRASAEKVKREIAKVSGR